MARFVNGSGGGLDARVGKMEMDIMAHARDIHGLGRKITQVDKKVTALKGQVTGIERQLTGIREQMADNQRVLLARLNVFIETQGGINRDFESRLPPRARRATRRRS